MKTAQEMVCEMKDGGIGIQAIANLTGLNQGHLSHIHLGDRKMVTVGTWKRINDAYLDWKAQQAKPRRAA